MRRTVFASVLAAVLALTGVAHAKCQIGLFAELPLEPSPDRALVKGMANGRPAVFILDTGAWASMMPSAEAQQLGVKIDGSGFAYTGYNIKSEGVGGSHDTGVVTFNMKLGSIDLPHEMMTVVPMGLLDHQAVALIGRELLSKYDLELDMPDHAVRIVKASGCSAEDLDYWNKPYSQAPIESNPGEASPILVTVLLNGRRVPAMIDSGAEYTTVTPDAARAAGADLHQSTAFGSMRGIGDRSVTAQIAHFTTFTLGDETIHDVNLVVSDMWKYNKVEETGTRLGSEAHDAGEPRMLIGADFLSAHRVMVANDMKMIVFSYIGGPIFPAHPEAAESATSAAKAPPAH